MNPYTCYKGVEHSWVMNMKFWKPVSSREEGKLVGWGGGTRSPEPHPKLCFLKNNHLNQKWQKIKTWQRLLKVRGCRLNYSLYFSVHPKHFILRKRWKQKMTFFCAIHSVAIFWKQDRALEGWNWDFPPTVECQIECCTLQLPFWIF